MSLLEAAAGSLTRPRETMGIDFVTCRGALIRFLGLSPCYTVSRCFENPAVGTRRQIQAQSRSSLRTITNPPHADCGGLSNLYWLPGRTGESSQRTRRMRCIRT